MTKAKLVLMRNTTKRVVNGVRPNQIVEVAEANLATYTMYGFEKYVPGAKPVVEGNDDGNDATGGEREAMEKFLKDHGVAVAPNWKDATIAKKAKELGYGEGQEFDATTVTNDEGEGDDANDDEGNDEE